MSLQQNEPAGGSGSHVEISRHPFADLTGLRAVVTGSSSGIGRAVALEFARAGADVVVHCRGSDNAGKEVVEEIRALGCAAEFVAADLSVEAELPAFAEKAWRCFGSVEIWVNNAGADLLTGDGAQLPYGVSQRLWKSTRQCCCRDWRASAWIRRGGGDSHIGWTRPTAGWKEPAANSSASKNAVMGFSARWR
jgi:3-oxoacyl-[acyl-carrier protein] reductase